MYCTSWTIVKVVMYKQVALDTEYLLTFWTAGADAPGDLHTAAGAGQRFGRRVLYFLEVWYGKDMVVRPGNMRRGVKLEGAAAALRWNVCGLGVTARANIEC